MCKNISKARKWLFIGVPIIFIVSALFHSLYDWTGIKLIGFFTPANESVWEHLKLFTIPIIAWWMIVYFTKGKDFNIDKNRWFLGSVVSLISAMLFMLAFYYTYSKGFEIKSLVLDIINAFLSILVGQLLGAHVYKHSKGIDWFVSATILIIIFALFAWLTVNPPELPIFLDSTTGIYGMQ